MTPKKKMSMITIGTYAGAILTTLALVGASWSFTLKILDNRIDSRIDNKTKFIVEILKQMATEDQIRNAEREMRRWIK